MTFSSNRCATIALVAALLSSAALPHTAHAELGGLHGLAAGRYSGRPLSHPQGRWRRCLLPGGRPRGRADRAPAARVSDLIPHVPQPDPAARGSLPCDRAGLSGLRRSAAPDHKTFAYTFGHYADIVDSLLTQLGVKDYAIYLMDYGAPVGYRLALKHPERVTALIVQNGNAYEEGLKAFWDPIKAYWADGSDAHRAAIDVLVAPETTKFQYTDGVADVTRIDPDNWGHDQPLLDRPGNKDIQLDLFLDYGTNVPLYPKFQAFFRDKKPPTLIVWGKNDKIFPADGATPYLRDLPDAELHLLDTGHFALRTSSTRWRR